MYSFKLLQYAMTKYLMKSQNFTHLRIPLYEKDFLCGCDLEDPMAQFQPFAVKMISKKRFNIYIGQFGPRIHHINWQLSFSIMHQCINEWTS